MSEQIGNEHTQAILVTKLFWLELDRWVGKLLNQAQSLYLAVNHQDLTWLHPIHLIPTQVNNITL